MSDNITIDPNASIAVECFRVMPNIRWIERDYDKISTIKVLQQLHLGDMGTEKWEDVPTVTELNQNKDE